MPLAEQITEIGCFGYNLLCANDLRRNFPLSPIKSTVKIGDEPIQVLSEVNWSLSSTAYFDPQEPNNSVLRDQVIVFSPEIGMAIYGRTPDDEINDARGDIANQYGSDPTHWTSRDPQNSFGQVYRFPIDFEMQ